MTKILHHEHHAAQLPTGHHNRVFRSAGIARALILSERIQVIIDSSELPLTATDRPATVTDEVAIPVVLYCRRFLLLCALFVR
jgi:hypothetical protein